MVQPDKRSLGPRGKVGESQLNEHKPIAAAKFCTLAVEQDWAGSSQPQRRRISFASCQLVARSSGAANHSQVLAAVNSLGHDPAFAGAISLWVELMVAQLLKQAPPEERKPPGLGRRGKFQGRWCAPVQTR